MDDKELPLGLASGPGSGLDSRSRSPFGTILLDRMHPGGQRNPRVAATASATPPSHVSLAAGQPKMQDESGHAIRIGLRSKGRIVFVELDSVIAVKAAGNHAVLEVEGGSFFVRESISEMAARLRTYGFIQIHRSVVVNGKFVEAMEARATGAYVLRMRGGSEYDVSRSFKGNLALLAHVWIGMGGLGRVELPPR